MAVQLKIVERRIDEVVILDLKGRLEVSDGDVELSARIDALLAEGVLKLVLNLKDLMHIDSRGIALLVARHLTLRKRGGDLRLLHVPERIRRVLAVSRLLTVFETFELEADAVANFGTRATYEP